MKNKKNNLLMWLLLFLLPPFGIIYVWIAKKEFTPQKKIKLTIIFGIWFACCAIFGNIDDTENKTQTAQTTEKPAEKPIKKPAKEPTEEPTEKPTEKPIKKPNPKTTPKKSKEDIIRETVEGTVGKENLETLNYIPDRNFCLIRFKANELLTGKATVKGMYIELYEVLRDIQPVIDTSVDINIIYPLMDKYGNAEDTIVIKATYKKKTIKKINFENALWENMPDIADKWWNHGAVDLARY